MTEPNDIEALRRDLEEMRRDLGSLRTLIVEGILPQTGAQISHLLENHRGHQTISPVRRLRRTSARRNRPSSDNASRSLPSMYGRDFLHRDFPGPRLYAGVNVWW
jgi:hypothetical protein